MAEITLQTPLTEEVIRDLKLEDTVYINGHIYGIRDATQIRIFDEGVPPPTDLTGAVCLHTAPTLWGARPGRSASGGGASSGCASGRSGRASKWGGGPPGTPR